MVDVPLELAVTTRTLEEGELGPLLRPLLARRPAWAFAAWLLSERAAGAKSAWAPLVAALSVPDPPPGALGLGATRRGATPLLDPDPGQLPDPLPS